MLFPAKVRELTRTLRALADKTFNYIHMYVVAYTREMKIIGR